ncbi:hypothetical protein AP75_02710 [Kaistella haifensis DSM 19056]|uniref:Uncharacterized protein n=1 Tax=Kaistella haifensis DSM 19056 TaxID=1450526 RepID=A0A246BBI7_9FLAO|nr:hypothetical protein AP75_02710 [Kaistella haifensis DSM 19056]
MAPISVFHSRFFVPLRYTKRAPFKPGRGTISKSKEGYSELIPIQNKTFQHFLALASLAPTTKNSYF